MGHYVEYIIDIGIEALLVLLDSEIRESYLSRKVEDENGLFESNIPGSKFNLHFDCGAQISVICFPEIKYSWLIPELNSRPDYIKVVDELDATIASWLKYNRIYRASESYVEEWASHKDNDFYDNWKNSLSNYSHFEHWLLAQDTLYWTKIK